MSRATAAVVTRDAALLRRVEAEAAGAGTTLVPLPDPASALAGWRDHPLVLLGPDVVEELRGLGPPHHPQLHLLAEVGAGAAVLRAALALGVRSVIDPGRDDGALGVLLAAVADPRPPGLLVAVAPGSGGAGASTLAATTALLAARHPGPDGAPASVALVVTDPWAPDPCLLLGSEPAPGLAWADLEPGRGRVASSALREALPEHDGVRVLGFDGTREPPSPPTLRAVLETARAAFDLTVVDLDLRDTRLTPEVVARCDRVWLVVRPRVTAVASARARVPRAGPRLRVLARGDGVPAAAVEGALGVEVAHHARDERRLDEWLDLGAGPLARPRSPLRSAARVVLEDAFDLAAAVGRGWP